MPAGTLASVAFAILSLGPALASGSEDAGTSDSLIRTFEARHYREVLASAPSVPRSLERDGTWLAAMALEKGPDAATAFSGELGLSPEERRRALAGATFRCIGMRGYDAARALFTAAIADAPPSDPPSLQKFREKYGLHLAALFSGLRRREDLPIPPSDPRAPVIGMMALSTGLPDDPGRVYAKDFGSAPPPAGRPAGETVPDVAHLGLRGLVFPPEVKLDVFLATAEFATTGDRGSGWRVLVTHPFVARKLEFFVVQEGGEARLLGTGGPGPPLLSGLGAHAGALIRSGEEASARQLVVWARESVEASSESRWSSFLAASTPDALASVEGLRKAADALVATGLPRASRAPVFLAAAPGWAEGMTRPVLRSSPNGGPAPDVPKGAGVSGLVIVKCVLTREARAQDCVVVTKLGPSIDQVIVDWLYGSTWTPVMFQGQPVQVSYVFNFKITAPSGLAPDAG